MENVNLVFFSIVISLVYLVLAIYYQKSKHRYRIKNSTYVLLCLIASAQWLYITFFLIGRHSLVDLSLGDLIVKLLLPNLAIIPALAVLIGEFLIRQREDS